MPSDPVQVGCDVPLPASEPSARAVARLPEREHAGLISGQKVASLSRHSATQYDLAVPGAARPVFEGLFDTAEVAPGLVVHRVDLRGLQDSAVRAVLKPGLRLALTIGGLTKVSIGHRRLPAGPGRGGAVTGALVAVVEPATFARQSRRGDTERTVSIAFSPQWLRENLSAESPLLVMASEHLAMHAWQPSAQALAAVEQMLRPPSLEPGLMRLYLRARVLDLLLEAAVSLRRDRELAEGQARLGKRAFLRMRQVRDLLESGAADGLSLEQIASGAHISVNTLQRHFRAAWGLTVFEYLREVRLRRARLGLERDGISVTEAAWLAGYTSAANFATAFKRRYGVSPARVRAAV